VRTPVYDDDNDDDDNDDVQSVYKIKIHLVTIIWSQVSVFAVVVFDRGDRVYITMILICINIIYDYTITF